MMRGDILGHVDVDVPGLREQFRRAVREVRRKHQIDDMVPERLLVGLKPVREKRVGDGDKDAAGVSALEFTRKINHRFAA